MGYLPVNTKLLAYGLASTIAYGYSIKILADETVSSNNGHSAFITDEEVVIHKKIGANLQISIDPTTGAILPTDQTHTPHQNPETASRSARSADGSTDKKPSPHPLQSYRVIELPEGGRMYELIPNSEGHYDGHLRAQYSVSIQNNSTALHTHCAIKNHDHKHGAHSHGDQRGQ